MNKFYFNLLSIRTKCNYPTITPGSQLILVEISADPPSLRVSSPYQRDSVGEQRRLNPQGKGGKNILHSSLVQNLPMKLCGQDLLFYLT